MEESFEEVMALNSVLKDGGKFIMLKEKSFNGENQQHRHGMKPLAYKDNT